MKTFFGVVMALLLLLKVGAEEYDLTQVREVPVPPMSGAEGAIQFELSWEPPTGSNRICSFLSFGDAAMVGINQVDGQFYPAFFVANPENGNPRHGIYQAAPTFRRGSWQTMTIAWDAGKMFLSLDDVLIGTADKNFPLRLPNYVRVGCGTPETGGLKMRQLRFLNECPPLATGYELRLRSATPDGIVAADTPLTLTMEAFDNLRPVTEGELHVRLWREGSGTVMEYTVPIGVPLPEIGVQSPGFLIAEAELICDGRVVAQARRGLGSGMELLQPGRPEPEDFDAFWQEGIREAQAVTEEIQTTPNERFSTDTVEVFDIVVPVPGGKKLYGFLSVPRDKSRLYPAQFTIPGAGPSVTEPELSTDHLVLLLNVHDAPVAADRAESLEVYNRLYPNGSYIDIGIPDREHYFYRGVILGAYRALEWLATHPAYNGESLVMHGSSQGGGLTLILTGLSPHITGAVANVPALCDHGGYAVGRASGWPRLAEGSPERGEVAAMFDYYDAVYFARRIRVPVTVSAGLVDSTCNPDSIAVAYGQIPVQEKSFIAEPTMGHDYTPLYRQAVTEMERAGQKIKN